MSKVNAVHEQGNGILAIEGMGRSSSIERDIYPQANIMVRHTFKRLM